MNKDKKTVLNDFYEFIEQAANNHVDLQYPMGIEREYPLDDFRAGARWMYNQLTGEGPND